LQDFEEAETTERPLDLLISAGFVKKPSGFVNYQEDRKPVSA
jgi:hypothetical protein